MDYMDFNKIHKAMKALDWKWYFTDGVPEIYEIRQFLREQLHYFMDNNLKELSCGGFLIRKDNDTIRVVFEVASWEVDKNNN